VNTFKWDSIRMSDWARMAFQSSVVRRGLLYAVVVGSVLIGINHGDAILRGDVGGGRLLRIALTVLVPYIVSTSSSVAAIRALRRPPQDSYDSKLI
jgi:hypothetical protein